MKKKIIQQKRILWSLLYETFRPKRKSSSKNYSSIIKKSEKKKKLHRHYYVKYLVQFQEICWHFFS